MKKRTFLQQWFVYASLILLITSCYGFEKEEYKTLSPITLSNTTKEIHVNIGEPLTVDLGIESELPVSYEWSYGAPSASNASYPINGKLTVISSSPNINYTFTRVGVYILRLKVDNGESINYHFFKLMVNSGMDEGIVLLTSDDSNQGEITFIKKRTAQEEANGGREIYENVFGMINPDTHIQSPIDLYIAENDANGNFPALIVSTSDAKGSIFKMDPRTFELQSTLKVSDLYPGVNCFKFAGFVTNGGRYTMVNGSNGSIYRYDLQADDIAERPDCANLKVTNSYHATFSNGTSNVYFAFFYNKSGIYTPKYQEVDSIGKLGVGMAPKFHGVYEIINMVYKRAGNSELFVITRRLADNKIVVHKMSSSYSAYSKRNDYLESSPIAMDWNSTMVTSIKSSYVYFNFDNKVYRWNYTSNLPDATTAPTITPPAGEQITAIGRSFDETQLYVATYNPSRSGKKGSLYLYNFSDHSLAKAYEGICDRPLKVFYKSRVK